MARCIGLGCGGWDDSRWRPLRRASFILRALPVLGEVRISIPPSGMQIWSKK
jgi:hypothetical protein